VTVKGLYGDGEEELAVDSEQLGVMFAIVTGAAGGAWSLGRAWTKKAIAVGERAEAERGKEREVSELRKSHEKFGERLEGIGKDVTAIATDLKVLTGRLDERERERARRDTLGIPVRSDGE
jgi:hypothetical protein